MSDGLTDSTLKYMERDENNEEVIRRKPKQKDALVGWICPKCKTVVSPYCKICPKCSK